MIGGRAIGVARGQGHCGAVVLGSVDWVASLRPRPQSFLVTAPGSRSRCGQSVAG